MGRKFLQRLIISGGIYFVGILSLALLGSSLEYVFDLTAVANFVKAVVFFFIIGFPTVVITWFGINFSIWLRNEKKAETLSFLTANLFRGFVIFGLSLAIGISIILVYPFDGQNVNEFAANLTIFIIFAGFFLSGIWVIGSFVLVIYRHLKSENNTYTNTTSHQTNIKKKKTESPAASSIFKKVPLSKNTTQASGSVSIPKRIVKESNSIYDVDSSISTYQPTTAFRIISSSKELDFVDQAQKYVNVSQKKVEPVPFMQYWPTYNSMTVQQQKWYFYWRSQLRKGNWLSADTSYLFVHVYEMINVVGFDSPDSALNQFIKFWKHYRKLQPKLDNYLPEWIADFIVIHNSSIKPLFWYSEVAHLGVSGDEDLQFEAWIQNGSDFEALSINLVYSLAGYSPTYNKFFKQFDDKLNLSLSYKAGIKAVNNYQIEKSNKSLFEIFQPKQTYAINRSPFAGALHNYSKKEIEIARVHFWLGSKNLGLALKNIIKYTENIIRDQNNFGYALRGIELETNWKQAIDKAFSIPQQKRGVEIDLSLATSLREESKAIRDRLITEEKSQENSVGRVKIVENENPLSVELIEVTSTNQIREIDLDFTKVEKLKQESEMIRESLILEEDFHDVAGEKQLPEIQTFQEKTINSSGYLIRPYDVSDHLLTDLQGIAAILGDAESDSAKVLTILMKNNWRSTLEGIQANFIGQFANVLIDEINEKSFEDIGDALIFEEEGFWIVEDEYHDEIQYILEHPEYQTGLKEVAQARFSHIFSDIEQNWALFASKMRQPHWDALAALLSEEDIQVKLDAIAQPIDKTGNLLIDEINEYAQECLGDILVDTIENPPHILEDKKEDLANLLDWALNQHLAEV